MQREARAAVVPVRQRTQFSCMSASMMMCLQANGHEVDEDEVNRVMGARPMRGAAWEQALACAQHYGCRATLTMPSTVEQLKAWTDQGIPVMIAWNPEGRDWSHASVVFDVDDDLNVYVADPNIPNPKKLVRVVPEDEFYGKWYEKFPDYLVRRPACAIDREVTEKGQPIMPRSHDDPSAFIGFQRNASLRTAEPYDCWKDGLRGRALADCYKQWPNDLGPEDIALIRRYDPGWEPPHVGLPASTRAAMHKCLVAYALKGLKAAKGIKFVKDLISRDRSLSAKQYDWWTKILRSNERITSTMPNGFEVVTWQPGVALAKSSFKGAVAAYVEKHFAFEIDGSYVRLLGPKPKETKAPRAPGAPAAPKTVVDSAVAEKVRILDTLATKVRGWPEGLAHVQKLKVEYAAGKNPSGDDLKKLRNILYKNRMRSEADHFRQAGYKGNPDGKDIYPAEVDHGYGQPLSGGWDIMKSLQNRLLHEQGNDYMVRDPNPRLAYGVSVKLLRNGEIVVNAGPSYQRSARKLIEKAGWDFRLIRNEAGSWIFSKGYATVDNLMKALAGVDPVRKAAGFTDAILEIGRGGRVRVNDAFSQAYYALYLNHIIKGSPRGGFTVVHPAADKDSTFNGGSEYDFYFSPAREKGWWDVVYSRGYLSLLQKDADKFQAQTVRLGANRAGRGEKLVRRVAARWIRQERN